MGVSRKAPLIGSFFVILMAMQPLTDRVLVEVEEAKKATASGILLQEDWKTLPPHGTILAVGPDVTQVKVGDKVIFERYAAVIMGERNQRMCQEKHIMATYA